MVLGPLTARRYGLGLSHASVAVVICLHMREYLEARTTYYRPTGRSALNLIWNFGWRYSREVACLTTAFL